MSLLLEAGQNLNFVVLVVNPKSFRVPQKQEIFGTQFIGSRDFFELTEI